jgi:elongation factor Ts
LFFVLCKIQFKEFEMTQITAEMVRDLREKTGAGMMDCKKALSETGDMEAAITFLREKGLAAAAKKAGRVASEGLVAIFASDNMAGMVEVNCETDFVARNPEFQQLVSDLAEQQARSGDGETLSGQAFFKDPSKTVESLINEKIATIGEKIALRRGVLFKGGNAYGSYIHSGGSIGALVELKLDNPARASTDLVKATAKDLAMHIAAASPLFLQRGEVDAKTLEQERHIFKQQLIDQGKPEAMLSKIIDGKMEKYYGEVCLLEQKFVKDPDTTITKLLEAVSKQIEAKVTLTRYARFKVGEGIEKKVDDFAQEVAKMVAH